MCNLSKTEIEIIRSGLERAKTAIELKGDYPYAAGVLVSNLEYILQKCTDEE